MIDAIIIGLGCLTAATGIGWLLWKTDRWAQHRLDEHVDTALAMVEARERHPATVAPRLTVPAARSCPICHTPVPFGPVTEHICGGMW